MDEESNKEFLISLSMICKDASQLSRVSEILARTGSGLTMEGLTVTLNMAELEPSSEGVEEQQ